MTGQNFSDNVTIPENTTPTMLVGRYRVVRKLGEGGMGSVWLAEDAKLDGRKVAIKMLPSILVSNKRAYAQVKAEALVSLKLSHPNIVSVRSFEEDNGNPFLVMDYIEGQTLDDYLADKGKLSEDETVKLLKPIAAALDYAHSQGVVHRDVKPGNVMIAADGHPYILDFGIAREVQETMTRVTGKFSSGTLMYMSPEQLNGDAPKPAQDIYSFAAMAYECLKGEPPFSRGQIEYQIVNNTPEPLGTQFAKCGPGVMAGLEKSPASRPSTCAAVLGDADRKFSHEQPKGLEKRTSKLSCREQVRRLLDARCVGHRVKLRMPIGQWVVFLVMFLYVAYFFTFSNFLFQDARRAVANARNYYEQGKDECFQYACSEQDLCNTQALYAFGGSLILFVLACLLYRLMMTRTRRTLQSFHGGRWVACVKSRFFSFTNDDWMLYVRACCAYFGLASDVKDQVKAVSLFSRAAKAGNHEAMYALSVVAGAQGGSWHDMAHSAGLVLAIGQEQVGSRRTLVYNMRDVGPEEFCAAPWAGFRLLLRVENVFWLVVWCGLGFLCAIESVVGVAVYKWYLCSDEFTWLFNFSYGIPASGILWHLLKFRNTWKMYCAFRNGSVEGVLGQRFVLWNDRDVLFWIAWANLFAHESSSRGIEKSCDLFERSATAGNADAYIALAYLAETGRTERYNAAYVSMFRREAERRKSRLLTAFEASDC